MCQIETNKI